MLQSRKSGYIMAGVVALSLCAAPECVRGGEPPAIQELVRLAPSIDSQDENCRSITVDGWFGSGRTVHPRVKFRAAYRSPDKFYLFVYDASNGAPLAYCLNDKMYTYDAVEAKIYYSEIAGFLLDMGNMNPGSATFAYMHHFFRKNRIAVDLKSILSTEVRDPDGTVMKDQFTLQSSGVYKLIKHTSTKDQIHFVVDMNRGMPFTSIAVCLDGYFSFGIEKLAVNGQVEDEFPQFPDLSKAISDPVLAVKDVTVSGYKAGARELGNNIQRTLTLRLGMGVIPDSDGNKSNPFTNDIAGDVARIAENDKKYAKTLNFIVPKQMRPGPIMPDDH